MWSTLGDKSVLLTKLCLCVVHYIIVAILLYQVNKYNNSMYTVTTMLTVYNLV